jgi:16S rRNA (guanine527-N7)-methyltransferase
MEILTEGARSLGLLLGPKQLAAFETYYHELAAWNERFNLTAISGYDEVQRRHFVDSLTCLLALPGHERDGVFPDAVPVQTGQSGLRCIDVGTGAGFPGLPIKLLMPDIHLTLLEATGKKCTFLRHMVEALGLQDTEVIQGRAEELGRTPEQREHYDVVLARAVARLAVLVEYCLPLCRVGGRLIAPKGEDAPDETATAAAAIETLGGKLVAIKRLNVLNLPGQRYLVVVDKVARTPDRFPRHAGLPVKRPL